MTAWGHMSEVPPTPAPAPLIPAATVVPLRDGPEGLEVLMLQRNSSRGAFAGYWVFPGGRVDETDLDDVACAVREAQEETGFQLDGSTFLRWSHWTPPVTEVKRFGTWFFLAPVPSDAEVNIDEAEIVGHQWLPIQSVLARRDAGEWNLAPPTFVTLTGLVSFHTTADALAHAASNPPELFATTMLKADGQLVVAWPPDAALTEGAHLSDDGPRHRLHINAPGPWRYERSDA
jgi:8-oxo-dGTP pyrophosphatase MutT (NUDIX family)